MPQAVKAFQLCGRHLKCTRVCINEIFLYICRRNSFHVFLVLWVNHGLVLQPLFWNERLNLRSSPGLLVKTAFGLIKHAKGYMFYISSKRFFESTYFPISNNPIIVFYKLFQTSLKWNWYNKFWEKLILRSSLGIAFKNMKKMHILNFFQRFLNQLPKFKLLIIVTRCFKQA